MKRSYKTVAQKQIIVEGEGAKVELTKGQWATVDAEDLPKIRNYSWCLNSIGYAAAKISGKTVYMHRYLLGLLTDRGSVIDHLNGNKLDNRKINLSITTQAANSRNRAKQESISGFRGLCFRPKENKPWLLYPRIGNRRISLGCFYNTALPAILFDSVQCLIADSLGIDVSPRSLNFPDVLDQTRSYYSDWLKSVLTDKQLDRLYTAVNNLVEQTASGQTAVYLAQRKDKAIKVGVSRNPQYRISDIRYGKVVGSCPSTQLIETFWFESPDIAYEVESETHERFSRYRIEGEWYQLEALEQIKAYLLARRDMHNPDPST